MYKYLIVVTLGLLLLLSACTANQTSIKTEESNSETPMSDTIEEIDIQEPSLVTDDSPVPMNGDFHPVIQGSQLLLGSDKQRWYIIEDFVDVGDLSFELKDIATDMVSGNEFYDFYAKNTKTVSIQANGFQGRICEATGNINTSMNFETTPSIYAIGISCDWDPLPRKLQIISPSHYVIDIDGDELKDIIHIVLNDDSKLNPNWQIVIENITGTYVATEISTMKNENNEPVIEVTALDLNGDNRMELILYLTHSYGIGTVVIECFDDHAITLAEYYTGN